MSGSAVRVWGGVVLMLIAATCASCSRKGEIDRQAGAGSDDSRLLEEQVRVCASGSDDDARPACQKAVRSGLLESGMAFPDSQRFYERIATTLVEERKQDAALSTYREGVSRYPENGQLHYQLGLLLIRQFAAYEEAYGPLLEATRWNAHSKEALTLLGEAQLRLRRYDESVGSNQAALRIDPKYVDALVGLGRALRSKGEAPDAVPPLSEAIRIAPENGFAHEQLGGALLDSGRPVEAVEALQRATKLLDYPRDAYCMLATALARAGRDNESHEACEAARKPRRSHRDEVLCACR
jgi:tetratricopeptide (TPR) repeat protein